MHYMTIPAHSKYPMDELEILLDKIINFSCSDAIDNIVMEISDESKKMYDKINREFKKN